MLVRGRSKEAFVFYVLNLINTIGILFSMADAVTDCFYAKMDDNTRSIFKGL